MTVQEKGSISFILVSDAQAECSGKAFTARYTNAQLKNTLQLMGCKTRVAHKISQEENVGALSKARATKGVWNALQQQQQQQGVDADGVPSHAVTLTRAEFRSLVLSAVKRVTDKSAIAQDFDIACSIREQRRCVVIFLAGTSGTGKSTLASLLAARLGITTVVSTDSIRHMLRSFADEESNPVLWASTYQVGDYVPDMSPSSSEGTRLDSRQRTVLGYKAQSEVVIERVERLVAGCEARKESLVVEGVHLSINFVVRLMAYHPSVVPFLVHISNEHKHRERFAVRAKYMTLDPGANRYVKHLRQIRLIQDYLVRRAERHYIPSVDNTNVDRSVAAIHATVLAALRRQARGEKILDIPSKTTRGLAEDYEQCKRDTWSSKGMLLRIRSRQSERRDEAPCSHEEQEIEDDAHGLASEEAEARTTPLPGACEFVSAVSSDAPLEDQQREGVSSEAATEESTAEQRLEGGSVDEYGEEQEEDEAGDSEPCRKHSADSAIARSRIVDMTNHMDAVSRVRLW